MACPDTGQRLPGMTLEERARLQLAAIVPGANNGYDAFYTWAFGERSAVMVEDAGHGHRAGRVSATYWDPVACRPTRAGVALTELAEARAGVASDADRGTADKLLDRPGEAISRAAGEVWDAVKGGIRDGAGEVGDGIGRVAAVVTEASARAAGRGVAGFWDELPAAGKLIVGVVGLVVAVVAARKVAKMLEK